MFVAQLRRRLPCSRCCAACRNRAWRRPRWRAAHSMRCSSSADHDTALRRQELRGQGHANRRRARGVLQGGTRRSSAPEQATVEYVVLDLESVKKNIAVGEKDLREYYAENEARYTAAEERRARHILVEADKEPRPSAKRPAPPKACSPRSARTRKVRRDREEELRRQGSAARRRPRLVRSRCDGQAARRRRLRLEAGRDERSSKASSAITSSRSRRARRRDQEVRFGEADDQSEVRKQLVSKKCAEAAEEFSDTVYEQPESLKPATDK